MCPKRRKKGSNMTNQPGSMTIEQIMAEADELIRKLDSGAVEDMKEEHRLQAEKHAQNLKKIKSEIQDKIEKKDHSKKFTGAEGMYEAIQDIVKASEALKRYLF
jgi:hypothetical protein